MSNNPISPFRIIDWNVVNFDYERGMFFIPDNLPHQWTIKAHIEKLKATEDALQAIVDIAFTLLIEHEGNHVKMQGRSFALCELNKEGLEKAEETFDSLLKTSAMVNTLANLRVFLMQQGSLLQLGTKRVMLPFINLNDMKFDEEITYTV